MCIRDRPHAAIVGGAAANANAQFARAVPQSRAHQFAYPQRGGAHGVERLHLRERGALRKLNGKGTIRKARVFRPQRLAIRSCHPSALFFAAHRHQQRFQRAFPSIGNGNFYCHVMGKLLLCRLFHNVRQLRRAQRAFKRIGRCLLYTSRCV